MATPRDRRNQLVWDALEAPGGGPKQALVLLNRRIKKGEKGDLLSVLRAYILTRLPHVPSAAAPLPSDEALSICVAVASQEPPPKDVDTIKLLERTFTALGASAEAGNLHERLYKFVLATPGRTGGPDEGGAQEWFGACTRVGDYSGMQRAAMFLSTKFPKKRDYYFWAIASCLLLYIQESAKAQEKSMFGMLSHRMISKAASDVPEANDKDAPPRSIQKSQELQFLFQALSTLDKDSESLKWFKSQAIGLQSKIVKKDEWVFLSKYIDLLEWKEAWDDVVEVCLNALEGSTSGDHDANVTSEDPKEGKTPKVWQDDWKIYKSLISAVFLGSKSQDATYIQAVYNTIFTNAETSQPSRNALLAQVLFASKSQAVEDKRWPGLLESCKSYFTAMSAKNCCFDDIALYIAELNETDLADFFAFMQTSFDTSKEQLSDKSEKDQVSTVGMKTTYLRFHFQSKIEKSSNDDPEELEAFIVDCLDVYNTSLPLGTDLLITDNQYGDDALLLAVQILLSKDCVQGGAATSLLSLARPIAILEYLVQSSKHNFTAILILIRLYFITGAFSLATILYPRLGIKHIQKDTLSHNILTRLSTLLPFPSPTATITPVSTNTPDVGVNTATNPTDAVELFKIAEKVYRQSVRQSPDMINLAFENEAYAQILDFVEFRKRLETSMSKYIYETERRKLSKLRGVNESFSARWDEALYNTMTDNRDWETHGAGILPRTLLGPIPKTQWIRAFTLVESIILLVTASAQPAAEVASSSSSSTSKSEPGPEPTQELQKLLDSHDGEELTVPEMKTLEAAQLIGKLELELRKSKSGAKVRATVVEITTYLKKQTASFSGSSSLLENGLSNLSVTESTWQYSNDPWHEVHSSFSILETCKNMLTLHDFLSNSAASKALKPPLAKQTLVDLKQTILALGKAVQESAKDKARVAKQVLESDIDQVMAIKDENRISLQGFFQDKIGRTRIEKILDDMAISRSEAWTGVGKVRLG